MTLTVDKNGYKDNTAAVNESLVEPNRELSRTMEQVKEELTEFKVDTNQQFRSTGRGIALVLQAIHELHELNRDLKSILRSLC